MSEGEPLQLGSQATNDSKKFRPKILNILALILTVVLICFIVYMFRGRITSVHGVADGMIYTVAPEHTTQLLDLQVQEGATVEKGAVVAHIETPTIVNEQVVQPNQGVANNNDIQPPQWEEIARRLRKAEEAEIAAARRVASARQHEEARKQQYDNYVMAHAQAEIRLRGLADQSPNNLMYQQLHNEVLQKKKQVELARDDFERASRVRAALNQELQRVHYEVQEAKRLASVNRYKTPKPAAPIKAPTVLKETIKQVSQALTAPVSGTVLAISAQAGHTVQKGDPILLIMPKDQTQGGLWINAWFNLDEGKKIKIGDECQIAKKDTTVIINGRVQEILQPSRLPGSVQQSANTDVLFLPVKIALYAHNDLKPGDLVECSLNNSWF